MSGFVKNTLCYNLILLVALLANFINVKDVVGREDGQDLWKFCKMKNILEIKKKCNGNEEKTGPKRGLG